MSGDVPRLTARQFETIRALTHDVCGIDLHEGKRGLVQSRLSRCLRRLGLTDFDAYLAHIEQDRSGHALAGMINALTTNKTGFFREPRHFAFLTEHVIRPAYAAGRPLRFWSAGCSSGEEPYSLAVHAAELTNRPPPEVRILATDVSTDVLARARAGVYAGHQLADLDREAARRWFQRSAGGEEGWSVRKEIRSLVRFARLNLMDPWPMKGPFDAILCRNVMIYFDKATQQRLVQRFTALLAPGGYLFVGHSESLSGLQHSLRYVQPAVYVR